MIRLQTRANVLLSAYAAVLMLLCGHAAAQPSGPVTQVAAGFNFTCALNAVGGVACWGYNLDGQLGDGTTDGRPVAADVFGLSSGVAAIAAGEGHACALGTGGGVKCWGANAHGEVGDNSGAQQLTPVDVFGLTSGVAAIAAGGFHTCALTTGGGVKCWGENASGQLGDNSFAQQNVPVDVLGLTSGVLAIAAGSVHTCALTIFGGVKCWGDDVNGQLGDNSNSNSGIPVDVVGLGAGVSAMAAGVVHTCALTTVGGVKCWGANDTGQLGDGTITARPIPGDVSGLAAGAGVTAIAAGTYHGCAVASGGVKCWGDNLEGQVGDNSTARRLAPVDVVGLATGVRAVTAGDRHTCALTIGGNVKCWGRNFEGQVGDGTRARRLTPAGVFGFSGSGIAKLALGEFHTCALTNAGGVKCWGFNADGELGNNSNAQSLVPVDVTGLTSSVAYLAGSKFHTCAVTTGGAAKCWGQNTSGSLGDGNQGNPQPVPTDVFGLSSGIASMTAGSNHTCALDTAGSAKCWGGNSLGVLGDGTYNQALIPVIVQQATNTYASISAGDNVTCAKTPGGVVQCWGANNAGQLGNGTLNVPVKINVPGNVTGLPAVISAMDAGGDHACVLMTNGGLRCWGANAAGQLGNGMLTPSATPADVLGSPSLYTAVSAGTVHTCAITAAGSVKCWGDNFFGQLGDGSGTGRSTPVNVVGLTSTVTDIEAGVGHTCAITTVGGVACWGHNGNGQLGGGENTTLIHPTPVVAAIGSQSIAFTPPTRLAPGLPVTLTATASSALPVTFDTWTPDTCTVTGNSVTASAVSLCGIRASQAGTGNISAAPQVLGLAQVSLTPGLIGVVSRKVHGAAGTFDLPLSTVLTNPTTEPRGGPVQTIVFTFDRPIVDALLTVDGTFLFASKTISGNDVIVSSSIVGNMQYVGLRLDNVSSTDGGTGGSAIVRVGYLLGDVNQSRVVTFSDLVLTNTELTKPVTASNFLKDVSVNGALTFSDMVLINSNLTRSLPAP